MQLNWIKAHVGFLGNEAADNLAKQATKEGSHLYLQAPKCHLKKILRNLSLNKWQQYWDSGDIGRSISNILPKDTLTPASWSREWILFATDHGPFPRYLLTWGKGRPSRLRNFLSHGVILSFYKTNWRKYSTFVEKRTFK
ncbi:hypothetical protein AVEN_154877-1 [Araneus ventricosus]|uniref:RNase H type-1 domain-containing protein n=1 Tax=Araneus ventricosus TaxID=182803 RepID=A0A4Y2A6T3_ARAVE|nr:hypothetical protein AVEN_154877-1 [Araneus ventricosus]